MTTLGTKLDKTSQKYHCPFKLLHALQQDRCNASKTNCTSNYRSHFIAVCWFGMIAGLHFCTFGAQVECPWGPWGSPMVTFRTTQGHQKGRFGQPWRTFKTRHRKHPKKTLFWDLFWAPGLTTFLVVFAKRNQIIFKSHKTHEKNVPKLHF